ncbi:aromatic ring-hydroxylating oxygenase subunit alpha [Mucilaginibacter boryungensis]|uniref:Aromatic ring-hydroxylating dioxygenase subunit alpha n=1 Tax=Mucilaginibacter boryungensis TaxID=768480 RepID=A0ABR9XF89_9SPHI|nr:aromatic ring-hydroxylating dioxygenase subunit alpha [Mucilaginibacter boryungensis]MBE9665850.1 aromatic ring-hydroxylating dioxygenase subunit alpha [Mucilaginibacter boryungensis]
MKSNISPEYYYSESIFQKEKLIFKNHWHFFGFKTQLTKHNDYLTRTIADTPVLVQNIKGEIMAFLNVCSHRFSILQQEASGNRPLVCPYHGWSYNQDGIPTGIPKKPLFQNFSSNELCELSLKSYQISFCGNLCFVNLSNSKHSLNDYLGDYFNELEDLSLSTQEMIDINQLDIKANWKIIVENTLESYHVGLIHTNTFKKLGASGLNFNFTSFHSSWDADLLIKRTDDSLKKIENIFAPRKYYINGYKHFLIFPNLLISTTHGSSYNFSLIEPLSPNETRFNSYVFLAYIKDDAKRAFVSAYKQTVIEFNREVFGEDKAICQLVQKGVNHTNLSGVLSLEEERVHAFQNTYIKLIQK